MGRALGNNLINMTAYKEVKEALDEMGIDLNVVEDQEPETVGEQTEPVEHEETPTPKQDKPARGGRRNRAKKESEDK